MVDKKIILTDIDGCLLNWREGFMRFMLNRGFSIHPEFEANYLLTSFYNVDDNEFFKQVEIFNSGRWEFGTLKAVSGAVKAINALTDLGYRFIGISACSSSKQAFVLRRSNLYNIFGDVFDAVHCLDIKDGKRSHLMQHKPTFWIDDKMDMCLQGIDAGHKCILMDYIWNRDQHDDRVERCQDWDAAVAYINTVLDEQNGTW